MRILAVDDESLALRNLIKCLKQVFVDAEIVSYNSPFQALDYVKSNPVDIAFLDIKMTGMNGVDLARKIKDTNSKTDIVFSTGFDEYGIDAFKLGASDYLLKPITVDKIQHAIENLRNAKITAQASSRVVIRCFGNFEVFIDGQIVHFKRQKSKELLAYLVNRKGASSNRNEIMAVIFDQDDPNYYTVAKKALLDTLKEYKCEDILINEWNQFAIDKSKVSCDYFDFLDGASAAVNAYHGEYMSQYPWAEETNSILFEKSKI